MLLKISCEFCGSYELKQTEDTTIFYCPTCDDEFSLNNLELEVVEVRNKKGRISLEMFVIPKKNMNNLKKGKQYKIINSDMYEYEIECEDEVILWISKDDLSNFEYHC